MFGKKRDSGLNERLDRVGREIVRASAATETEAEAAASSSFLYARVRSRIAAERERREAGESWLAMLSVMWRTVPVMALATVFALVLFLSTSTGGAGPAGSFIVESLMDAPDAGVEQVVFADRQPLSSDEVLATILSDDERETLR
jgi:hypothetical protein